MHTTLTQVTATGDVIIAGGDVVLPARGSHDAIEREFDNVRNAIKEGKLEAARALLAQIQARYADEFLPKQRWMLKSLLADICMREGNDLEGARLLIEALTFQIESEGAWANAVVG